MSGIIGSKLNIRGSGRIAKLGTDGQVLTSAGAGQPPAFEAAAAGGKIGQIQYTQITDTEETTATSFETIPTLQVTITPSASDSLIAIDCYLSFCAGASAHSIVQLFRDATQIAMGDEDGSTSRAIFGWRSQGADLTYSAWPLQFRWIDNPADVSAHTYSMKWYVNTANAWLGRTVDASDSLSYNRSPCSISASEILA